MPTLWHPVPSILWLLNLFLSLVCNRNKSGDFYTYGAYFLYVLSAVLCTCRNDCMLNGNRPTDKSLTCGTFMDVILKCLKIYHSLTNCRILCAAAVSVLKIKCIFGAAVQANLKCLLSLSNISVSGHVITALWEFEMSHIPLHESVNKMVLQWHMYVCALSPNCVDTRYHYHLANHWLAEC